MNRSLDTINFMKNNAQNMWSNPIINNSFIQSQGGNLENSTYGITTRGNRKLDYKEDLHLRRSMLQPDFRQGNRFYEFKPENTRRESYRDAGNKSAQEFQNQTQQMFNDMNYTKAYDQAAGMNRGSQPQ
jgi:hypothetical protein